jgi:hypothetical protein
MILFFSLTPHRKLSSNKRGGDFYTSSSQKRHHGWSGHVFAALTNQPKARVWLAEVWRK